MNNPNLQQAVNLIQTVGNPQQAFIQLAQQNGWTTEDIREISR